MQSEVYEGAMNCMAVVHRDSKLIVGKNLSPKNKSDTS